MITAKPLSYWETSPATFTPAAGLAIYASLAARNTARPTRAHGIQRTRFSRRQAAWAQRLERRAAAPPLRRLRLRYGDVREVRQRMS
jgi:hypothetical protein